MNENSKLLVAVLLAFLLGGFGMWGYQQSKQPFAPKIENSIYDDFFDDHFFEQSRSPFEEMERMQKEMDKMFSKQRQMPNFDSWFDETFGAFPSDQIGMRETTDVVEYVLDIADMEVTDAEVLREDDYVTITAQLKSDTENQSTTVSINQKLPVPGGVDDSAARIRIEDDELIVVFQKQK
jgi:HSP20 family molecular chaperone IbpA